MNAQRRAGTGKTCDGANANVVRVIRGLVFLSEKALTPNGAGPFLILESAQAREEL